ncbi:MULTISPECIES: DUF983 domain-containing protein [unclassified Devosia]|uniref:DUF983 domain-containing protein n=1 Tax=unclassified Devosia TaxID=196773 RepID=UPI00145C5B9B|nr:MULTISPECIES: DUF983 domain-containing protein [unclassified Devosia]MBJ6986204.1 DUF983 domain-containing protein [Devosia sp. MC521]MBJ7576315.1 DUF983 domain-containing protein [Devosia sp. MC532]MBK1793003.1 DUF983 domain-containing protein [Devosia sp. WQ 349K1]QMW64311.1 DUF983 domain-containing protein [Devosia sp. MC521]
MTENSAVLPERTVGQAMWRGALCRCPHCGKGKMFAGYLKVANECNVCGEELRHHRADDLPPYVAITIVGHIIVFLMLHLDMTHQIQPITYVLTMIPLAIVLPLIMLPSIKGAIVGLQWSLRMYGFGTGQKD